MTQLTNPATRNHPNFVRAQAASDAARLGDYGPTFDLLAEEIILENGPGARPVAHRARQGGHGLGTH